MIDREAQAELPAGIGIVERRQDHLGSQRIANLIPGLRRIEGAAIVLRRELERQLVGKRLLNLNAELRAEAVDRAVLLQDQRAVDGRQVARRKVVVARQDVGVLTDQYPELARIVGVLKRDEQVLEITPAKARAPAKAIVEEVAVRQVDFIDQRGPQAGGDTREVKLRTLAHASEGVGSVGIEQALGKTPGRQFEVARIIDETGVGLKGPAPRDGRG